jgi:hypothetical protein
MKWISGLKTRSRPEKEKPKIEKLNSRFTLISPIKQKYDEILTFYRSFKSTVFWLVERLVKDRIYTWSGTNGFSVKFFTWKKCLSLYPCLFLCFLPVNIFVGNISWSVPTLKKKSGHLIELASCPIMKLKWYLGYF